MAIRVKRVTPRFILFLLAFAVIIGLIVWLMLPKDKTAIITWGALKDDATASCVILRDETVYASEDFGKMVPLIGEGERVPKGTKIAEVYKSGYNDKTLLNLDTLRQDILNHQQQNLMQNIVDNDLNNLSQSINDKINEIADVVQNFDGHSIAPLELELKRLMQERQDYLRRTVVADDALNTMYATETELLTKIIGYKKDFITPSAGVVSFTFDGCEGLLNTKTLSSLTYDDVRIILRDTGDGQGLKDQSYTPLFRMINTAKWYILVLSEGGSDLKSGQSYEFSFEGYPEKSYTGKLISQKASGKNILDILEMTEDIGPLVNAREVRGVLGKRFEGLRVPRNAVWRVGTQDGVYISEGAQKVFIPVDVLVQDNDYVIIQCSQEGDTLEVNQQVYLK